MKLTLSRKYSIHLKGTTVNNYVLSDPVWREKKTRLDNNNSRGSVSYHSTVVRRMYEPTRLWLVVHIPQHFSDLLLLVSNCGGVFISHTAAPEGYSPITNKQTSKQTNKQALLFARSLARSRAVKRSKGDHDHRDR